MDAIYNTITVFSTMVIFYLFFMYVLNPRTNMIQKIGDKAFESQKSYNRYFLFMMMVPAMVVALLFLSKFSDPVRNVVMGTMLGITVFISTEVGKYKVEKFSNQVSKKKRKK